MIWVLPCAQAADSNESESTAVELLKSAVEEGSIAGFEGAQQVPKRDYTLAELKLNNVDTAKLLTPVDNTITTTRSTGQVCMRQDGMEWRYLFRHNAVVHKHILEFSLFHY